MAVDVRITTELLYKDRLMDAVCVPLLVWRMAGVIISRAELFSAHKRQGYIF